jgi:serine/threonine-protein kinase
MMSADSRVQQLLDEILDSERSPEEVCADCPELLTEVRERWQQMRRVEAELDAMFPTPAPNRDAITPAPRNPDVELPQIPGYQVEAVLGRGGMGIVFKARHLRLNRAVALKMLLPGAYAGLEERERFLREAEAVASLRHANLVQVHDVGDHDGRPYFTMEYVEDGNLAQKLVGKPQPALQAAELVATLAKAVQVAHQSGIVHRDLKPANILLHSKAEIQNLESEHERNRGFRISDFIPKIADFGLARHFDSGTALTKTGDRMGTPSYMAPEQAMGKTRAIGPAADIYSLGAVLYELLTGRPPFRGETTAETELQVIFQDPVPPSRLNPRVPRDLETICLKCLAKDPPRRYANAAGLADDLHRFQRGESIAARRPGSVERLGKWVRRRPAVAALLGATLLLTIVLMGGSLWLAVHHGQLRQAVEGDLREVAVLQRQARWTDARAALERAEARLGAGELGDGGLRQRINQARRDLDLVIELDRIRLSRATRADDLLYYKSGADRQYLSAFEDSGLANGADPPDVVAARVNASAVHVALLAALDDWTVCVTDRSRRDWLLAIARETDPDPLGWSDRIRDPERWDDQAALSELAEAVPVKGQSVSLLLGLGARLRACGGDATGFLKRVQKEHPADFWANMVLGDALFNAAPSEAAGFYRAALASRPEAAVAYTALGDALRTQNRHDEAISYYRQALQIDPNYARGHTNLGNLLKDMGQTTEAIACFRTALQIDPHYAWGHLGLAYALSESGQLEEALEHYRRFLETGPTIPHVVNILRSDRVRRGQGEVVRREWKKALDLDPPNHDSWFGYAELCLFLGDVDEYRRARQALIRRFGDTSDAWVAEKTARAILLMPSSDADLRTAVALVDRALAAKATTPEWVYPYCLFAKGLAEYRQGDFESAIATMKTKAGTVMGPCPRFIIAMAQYRLGDEQESLTTLAAAIVTVDWGLTEVRSHDHWLWHVLRREAETGILPNLAAFLNGKYEPQDNTERLALLGVCRFKNRTYASARLYAAAFAADATLADNLWLNHRYNAARAAALAGCGQGEDAAPLGASERKRWREQARKWLQADLAGRVHAFEADPNATRAGLHKALTSWREDPDLAWVRDPGELNKLGADERKAFRALWAEVEAVLVRMES